PVHNLQRDGHMQMGVPKGRVNYEPSSLDPRAAREAAGGLSHHATGAGDAAKGRVRPESFADHYTQARLFYRSQSEVERTHIATALVFELSKVETAHVRAAMVGHLRHVDAGLAERVAGGLGMSELPPAPRAVVEPKDMPPSPALRIIDRMKPTLAGRAVGILVHEGSDAAEIKALKKAAEGAGAAVKIVAQKLGGATLSDGKKMPADGQLAGTPSMIFDAVAVVLTPASGKALATDADAVDFVRDAFGHLKAIAASAGAKALLDAGGVRKDPGVLDAADVRGFVEAAKTRQW